ncbi:MAG: hypothetical protein HY089_08920 [Ignavibacteriales bacterium]|nr:hypothetical protein [Ignavibacteriales bacterium]
MNPVTRIVGFLAILFIAILSVSYGQGGPGGPMGRPPQERVEQFKKIRLMEVLQLDEQTAIKFFARYNKHAESFRENRMKRNAALDQVVLMKKTNAADKDFEKIIHEVRSLDAQLTETWLKYLDELSEVLTTKQMAEYLAFEKNFTQNLRDLMNEIQKEREARRMR